MVKYLVFSISIILGKYPTENVVRRHFFSLIKLVSYIAQSQ